MSTSLVHSSLVHSWQQHPTASKIVDTDLMIHVLATPIIQPLLVFSVSAPEIFRTNIFLLAASYVVFVLVYSPVQGHYAVMQLRHESIRMNYSSSPPLATSCLALLCLTCAVRTLRRRVPNDGTKQDDCVIMNEGSGRCYQHIRQ